MTMKHVIAITVGLGVGGAACSQDAGIGIELDPVTCQPAAAGSIEGHVAFAGSPHEFGAAEVVHVAGADGAPPSIMFRDSEKYFAIHFFCTAPELATYTVVPTTGESDPACPYEIGGSVLVADQSVAPAVTGIVIVDEVAACLAGRFHVELGGAGVDGDLVGWFSTPWPGT
jgi:hypothetical protein